MWDVAAWEEWRDQHPGELSLSVPPLSCTLLPSLKVPILHRRECCWVLASKTSQPASLLWIELAWVLLGTCHSASLSPLPNRLSFFCNHDLLAARTWEASPHAECSCSKQDGFSSPVGGEVVRYSFEAAANPPRLCIWWYWRMSLWAQRVTKMVVPSLSWPPWHGESWLPLLRTTVLRPPKAMHSLSAAQNTSPKINQRFLVRLVLRVQEIPTCTSQTTWYS